MANQYNNKVVLGNETLIDITDTTAVASDVAQGKYFYLASGQKVVGTNPGGGSVTQDAQGYIVLPETGDGTPTPTPSGPRMSDPIRFFDYDGTLVASYTAVPNSLPSVPTHTGLTNGTWNYTLQQVTTQFNAMGTCNVGANYETSSGKTEIDVEFVDSARLHPYLSLAVKGTVEIDWGDGSTPDTATGTSLTTRLSTIHHEYSAVGKYTIKVSKTSGDGYSLYCSNSSYTLLNKNLGTSGVNRVYSNCVKAVRVGEHCTIGAYAFNYCYSLKSVSIPSGATISGSYQFSYCYSLKSVSIPSGVTLISSNMFNSCRSVMSVSIPSGVTSIEPSGFNSCNSLESIAMPSSVTSIGGNAFSSCFSLKSIEIPSGVTSIKYTTFNGCYSLESVNIPSGVTSIEYSAFSSCYSLESIEIPSGVTSIGYNTFNSCFSLASIDLPSNLTTISANKGTNTGGCFQNCFSLASITIPAGVAEITKNDFSSCSGVAEYHFLRTASVPTLADTNAFTNIQPDCVIYVPASKLNDYKTAENWSTYADYMVGE